MSGFEIYIDPEILEEYVAQKRKAREIVALLHEEHQIQISMRALRYKLSDLDLSTDYSLSKEAVYDVVEEAATLCGDGYGYDAIRGALRAAGITVAKSRIQHALAELDPTGRNVRLGEFAKKRRSIHRSTFYGSAPPRRPCRTAAPEGEAGGAGGGRGLESEKSSWREGEAEAEAEKEELAERERESEEAARREERSAAGCRALAAGDRGEGEEERGPSTSSRAAEVDMGVGREEAAAVAALCPRIEALAVAMPHSLLLAGAPSLPCLVELHTVVLSSRRTTSTGRALSMSGLKCTGGASGLPFLWITTRSISPAGTEPAAGAAGAAMFKNLPPSLN
eukprot:tig00000743_g3882.t1